MAIHLKIHNRNHLIKSMLGNAEFMLSNRVLQQQELTVINYHGTQQQFIPNFKKQLGFFSKEFSIIAPQQLPDFYAGRLSGIKKPLLLITFDDGIKNNLYAAEVLNEYNIKAFFFVIPAFIDTPVNEQKNYFIQYIRPEINAAIDDAQEDFNAMSRADLKKLIAQGHVLGSHTNTHRLVAKNSSEENSIYEIKNSKAAIADLSGMTIDSFCSINNTLESISQKELQLIKENYNYHFTTIPGPNKTMDNPYFIKRSNVESHWLLGAVKYAVGKWDLKRWADAENRYLKLLR